MATADACNESEQVSGFFTLIEDNLAVPFTTRVLGQVVTVIGVDLTESDQIVTICMLGNTAQAIPILDLPIPTPLPEGAEWIERLTAAGAEVDDIARTTGNLCKKRLC